MAQSSAHKFGQIIGNIIEEMLCPVLQQFCDKRGLYLDVQGERKGVRKGRKVTWVDNYGNLHDLDFVIEKDGSAQKVGRPVAFIEAAWRRYTKHSRNKAQEIQGAILPIAEKFYWDKPFLGAVLAGEFTQGSINQLQSVGFQVLYFSYSSIVSAFADIGVDVQFDETTSEDRFRSAIDCIENLDRGKQRTLQNNLREEQEELFNSFLKRLENKLDRCIDRLMVIPLFGDEEQFGSVTEAIEFLEGYVGSSASGSFIKFEIIAKYSNGDNIEASFYEKEKARAFLEYLGT